MGKERRIIVHSQQVRAKHACRSPVGNSIMGKERRVIVHSQQVRAKHACNSPVGNDAESTLNMQLAMQGAGGRV
jgi:hypothetical protein